MTRIARIARFFSLSLALLAASFTVASAQQQMGATTDGGLYLNLTDNMTAAFQGQGVTWYPAYFNHIATKGYPGFEITNSNFDMTTGQGEILAGGYMHFQAGSLYMDLKNLQIENFGTKPSVTAGVYYNGVFQGRQEIFTSMTGSAITDLPMHPGTVKSVGLTYLGFSAAFAHTFGVYFQMPNLEQTMDAQRFAAGYFSLTMAVVPGQPMLQ